MKFIILKRDITQRFLLKKRIYKKLRCNSTVKIRFSRKKDTKLCQVSITSFFYFYTKLAESSFLCRFRIESVNVFILLRFDLCHVHISFINKQCHTCANAFPNEFTVRSYEYCTGKHWILYWIQENKTVTTYFLRSRLFTYDIMKNINCNQYKTSNIGNF